MDWYDSFDCQLQADEDEWQFEPSAWYDEEP